MDPEKLKLYETQYKEKKSSGEEIDRNNTYFALLSNRDQLQSQLDALVKQEEEKKLQEKTAEKRRLVQELQQLKQDLGDKQLQLSVLLSDAGEPLYVSDADVKAFAAEKVARATFIAIGTAKVNGTPLTATETVAAAEFASKLCEDARSMGMDAAWEKNKLDILKLLDADITTEESPVSTALFTVGAGVFSDKLAADVLAMEAGDVLLLTEEDGSLFIVCREELAADQDVEELRAQYTAVNGYDMLQEYIAAQLNGWQFVADDAAAAKLSPESLRFA